ncbi:ArsR/SmtB family transcription factor [Nitrogeniibacter aestuarii]|uniref:ArsR/SmtB family transcription factor n=1 Tax=Nitrogeniibacter aestuarii TaxID=2815343 RepID=UPI001E4FC7F0|nr:helix-turn-helix domain-containing protein [Nitrogeniibacter aestuarii]
MQEAHIYKALGDPTRLEMLRRLSMQAGASIGELSAGLGMSRQGARKQLQVLVDANVVRLMQRGRQTEVVLAPEALAQAREFIACMERDWDARLGRLKQLLESDPGT